MKEQGTPDLLGQFNRGGEPRDRLGIESLRVVVDVLRELGELVGEPVEPAVWAGAEPGIEPELEEPAGDRPDLGPVGLRRDEQVFTPRFGSASFLGTTFGITSYETEWK